MNTIFKGKRALGKAGILDPTVLTDSEYRKLYGKAKPKQIKREIKEVEKERAKKKNNNVEKHKSNMKQPSREKGKKELEKFTVGLEPKRNKV